MALRFNTFRSERYLRSKFVEGKYLLAAEATDIELEMLDLLRKVVNSTIGDVAIEDAFKVERLSDTQILIKPGQAWFKGLPFAMRGGKDQLVTGAILSLGTVPVGTTATDDSTGLGKVITFNSGSTTPSALYRIVITAREELITEVDDPFLQNVNLTESTAQKVRLNFQLNIVPESLQTETPVPYRDESSASGSVTNFPNAGGMAAPNYVNQIQVTGSPAGNGELIALNPISGSEGIDGRDLEAVIRNNSGLGGGNPIPNSPTSQEAFSNGKLIDSYGNKYHVNAIFNDTVSTQVVIRIDKEPDQPNPQFVNGLPFTLVKREVYVTDDSNGVPQGKLHWAIATLDWNATDGIVHESKIVDLRTSVSKESEAQRLAAIRDNLKLVGGGDVGFNAATEMLEWNDDFTIINPSGLAQTIGAASVPLADGGSIVYEMDLNNGGSIGRGLLGITVSSGGTTATLASVDLSQVRIGNILVDNNGDLHVITEIDNVNDTVTAATSIAAGGATIYLDSFGPGYAPLSETMFVLSVRSGASVLIGGEEEESEDEDRNLKLVRGGTWSWNQITTNFTAAQATINNSLGVQSTASTQWFSQSFTSTLTGNFAKVRLRLAKGGSPTGNIVVKLYNTVAGVPNALLATSTTTLLAQDLTGVETQYDFNFPITPISSGTVYAIVLDVSGVTFSGGQLYSGSDNTASYGGGTNFFSNDGGASWGDAGIDLYFIAYTATTTSTLQWSDDAFIQIPGLSEDRNTISSGSQVLNNDGEVLYTYVNRVAGSPATLTLSVAAIEDVVPSRDLVIIARRIGNDVIVGSHSTRLKAGQSSELDAQMSDQNLAFMGAGSTADNSPTYSSNNYVTDGNSLETSIGDLDTELAVVSGAVSAIQWKAPVVNFAALPAVGNTDGDVRLVLDTRIAYHWDNSATIWKPLNGTGGGVKVIGGGTISWTAPNLTFTADMYLEIKGLVYTDNTIAFSTQSPIVLNTSLDVVYVIPNLTTGGPALTVTVGTLSSVPVNAIIIARREGTDVIVGSSSTRLKSGQSTDLYAQASNQNLSYIGATSTADGSPAYSANNYVTDGNNLTASIGDLDAAVATKIGNVVEDTTPELGGNLDVNGHRISGSASDIELVPQNLVKRAKFATPTSYIAEEYIHSISLLGSQTNTTISSFTHDASVFDTLEITYKIKQASTNALRVGVFSVTTDGTNVSYTDEYTETANLNITLNATISGSDIIVRYTTATANSATMRADVKKYLS